MNNLLNFAVNLSAPLLLSVDFYFPRCFKFFKLGAKQNHDLEKYEKKSLNIRISLPRMSLSPVFVLWKDF